MKENNLNEKVIKVFIDFDGTITKEDIGESFLKTFGKPDEINKIVQDWFEEKITSPQSWHLMLDTISNFNQIDFENFLLEKEIDPYFKKFVEFCDQNKIEIMILSDGLDIYIKNILRREGLDHLKFFSNKIRFENNKLIPVFPHGDEECKFCGNCKRNHILVNSGDDEFTIYIGDGYSDKCPVEYCDFVFAKKSLLKYCEKNRITYFPFQNFNDVIKKLTELNSKKRLKKKHQAQLKRREVYLQG